jgi:hypothetical protein
MHAVGLQRPRKLRIAGYKGSRATALGVFHQGQCRSLVQRAPLRRNDQNGGDLCGTESRLQPFAGSLARLDHGIELTACLSLGHASVSRKMRSASPIGP